MYEETLHAIKTVLNPEKAVKLYHRLTSKWPLSKIHEAVTWKGRPRTSCIKNLALQEGLL